MDTQCTTFLCIPLLAVCDAALTVITTTTLSTVESVEEEGRRHDWNVSGDLGLV